MRGRTVLRRRNEDERDRVESKEVCEGCRVDFVRLDACLRDHPCGRWVGDNNLGSCRGGCLEVPLPNVGRFDHNPRRFRELREKTPELLRSRSKACLTDLLPASIERGRDHEFSVHVQSDERLSSHHNLWETVGRGCRVRSDPSVGRRLSREFAHRPTRRHPGRSRTPGSAYRIRPQTPPKVKHRIYATIGLGTPRMTARSIATRGTFPPPRRAISCSVPCETSTRD